MPPPAESSFNRSNSFNNGTPLGPQQPVSGPLLPQLGAAGEILRGSILGPGGSGVGSPAGGAAAGSPAAYGSPARGSPSRSSPVRDARQPQRTLLGNKVAAPSNAR
jgi:hypothetical protein